jgi:hypothetical protein
MFEDLSNIGSSLPEEKKRDLDRTLSSMPDPNSARARMANTQWLAHELKVSPQQARNQYSAFKNAYSRRIFGEDQVNMSDTEFYSKVQSSVIPERKKQREFVDIATSSAYKAAALGMKEFEGYHEVVSELMTKDGYKGRTDDIYHRSYSGAFKSAQEQLSKHRKDAEGVFEFLSAKMGVDGAKSDMTKEDVVKIIDGINPEDTDKFLYVIQAMADASEDGDEKSGVFGGLQKSGESFWRGVSGVASNLRGYVDDNTLIPVSQGKRVLIAEGFDPSGFDSEDDMLSAMMQATVPTQIAGKTASAKQVSELQKIRQDICRIS